VYAVFHSFFALTTNYENSAKKSQLPLRPLVPESPASSAGQSPVFGFSGFKACGFYGAERLLCHQDYCPACFSLSSRPERIRQIIARRFCLLPPSRAYAAVLLRELYFLPSCRPERGEAEASLFVSRHKRHSAFSSTAQGACRSRCISREYPTHGN